MPSASDPKKSSKEASSSSKDAKSSRTKDPSSASSSSTKPSKEIRQAEYQVFVTNSLVSHGGYLAKPITSISSSLDLPAQLICYTLALFFFVLHIILPPFLLPHLSALITLTIPTQCTMRSIRIEMDKKSNNAARDSCQWLAYWVVYALFDFGRGWVGIWRPGWKAGFGIVRSAGLVAVAGPWFGREGLVSGRASESRSGEIRADDAHSGRNRVRS
jgi:hypothetical protein